MNTRKAQEAVVPIQIWKKLYSHDAGTKDFTRKDTANEKSLSLDGTVTWAEPTYKTAFRCRRTRWSLAVTSWRPARIKNVSRRYPGVGVGLQSKPSTQMTKTDSHKPTAWIWQARLPREKKRSVDYATLKVGEAHTRKLDAARTWHGWAIQKETNHQYLTEELLHKQTQESWDATIAQVGENSKLIAVCDGDQQFTMIYGSALRYLGTIPKMWRHHGGDAATMRRLFNRVRDGPAAKVMPRRNNDISREYKMMSPQRWCPE